MPYKFSLALVFTLGLLGFPSLTPAQSINDITSAQQPPLPPASVRISIPKGHPVISWENSKNNAITTYYLFRADKANPDNVQNIAEIPHTKPDRLHPRMEYTDMTAPPGHTYIYFLTDKDEFGLHSVNSQMVSGIMLPSQSNQ